MNAALVMRDRETDSWWSIMTGTAIGGNLNGTRLKELPGSQKMQWKDWVEKYPDTKVLSVDGIEHDESDPYANYFTSDGGFRGMSSEDKRLDDKAPIFAFQLDDQAYAVTHEALEGGAVFTLGDGRQVFLYRDPGSSMFASTLGYVSAKKTQESRFAVRDGQWIDTATGSVFDAGAGFPYDTHAGAAKEGESVGLFMLGGFDTFWYIWSTTHHMPTLLE